MDGHAPGLAEPRAGSDHIPTLLLVSFALAAGVMVSALGVLGTPIQVAVVLALGAAPAALMLFTARPHLALASYLLLLPLALNQPLVAGMNGGELLTAGALLLGLASLWQAPGRFRPALRALAALTWPLVGLALVSTASLMVNGVTGFGEILDGLFKSLAFAGVALLVHMHATTERRALTMVRALVAGAFLVAVYTIVAYVLGWSYSEEYDWNRATGTFDDYNTLGGYMVLMSGVTLGAAAVAQRHSTRLLLGVAFALQLVAMLLSLTLGSLVAFAGGAALTLLLVVRVRWTRLLAVATTAAIGFAIALATNESLREKLTRIDERTIDRVRSYAVGVAMFRDRFLLGFGTQSEVVDALWYGEADYGLTAFGASSSVPHNSLLLIGVEKGALGVVFFVLLIVGLLRLLLRNRGSFRGGRYELLYAGAMVGVLGFLIQDLVNNLILHARVGILFFALVALIVRLAEFERARARVSGSVP